MNSWLYENSLNALCLACPRLLCVRNCVLLSVWVHAGAVSWKHNGITRLLLQKRGLSWTGQCCRAGHDIWPYMVIGSCFGAAYQSFIRLAKESLPRCAGSSCSSWIAACLGFLLIINSKLNNVENKNHPYTSQPLCCQQSLYLQHWLSMTLTYDF